MRLLVTGATGQIGPAVVRELLRDGHELRVLTRPSSDRSRLEGLELSYVEGDVTQPETLPDAMRDVRAVVHMAGLYDSWARRPRDFFDVNTVGTINVRDAAAEAGLRRMLFVSSSSTIGERQGEVGSEDTPRRDFVLGDYEASKLDAESALLAAGPSPEIVIVNPSNVYGPNDITGNGRAIINAVNGRLGMTVDVMTAFVHVDDVARGIAAALIKGPPGQRFILSGDNISRLEFLRRAILLSGVDVELRVASPTAWRAFAALYGAIGFLTRRRPPISKDAVQIALYGSRLDGGKAERELGISYTPLDEGLDATLDWLHENGYVALPEEEDEDQPDDEPEDESEDEADDEPDEQPGDEPEDSSDAKEPRAE
jgi:dihydroflavonol-4-reductase